MNGKTNCAKGNGGPLEFVNIRLITNQSEHSDLIGSKILIRQDTRNKEYEWKGSEITFTIPAYIEHTIEFPEVEGYKKPDNITFVAVEGNSRTIEAEYKAELVKVNVTSSNGSAVSGAKITINGKQQTWNGTEIRQLVPFGTQYSVVASAVSGFGTPSTQTFTAQNPEREVSVVYIASSLKVNILSNQGTDAAIANVKATVKYSSTSVQVANGGTVNLPMNTSVTISFPEIEGYKKPADITYTHTGGIVEKSGIYQCELLTVNVSADSGTPTGFEVTISRQETVGVATKYTRLEYIEANGNQSLDTNLVPSINTTVVADLLIPSGVGNKNLFCAYTNYALNSMSDSKLEYRLGSGNWTQINTPSNVTNKFNVEFSCKTIKFNGEIIATPNLTSLSNTYTLLLFTRSGGSSSYYGKARIYTLKIYENGNIVRDYIPALRSDGIAGLYDAVNDAFYASSGSSNFLYGAIEPTIVAKQTSVTGTYKIPFDASYKVSASNVSGYTTPASITGVASQKNRAISMQYAVERVRDLSMMDIYGNPINRSTANCYVVREVGQYKFPLVYGNAIKNGQVNTAAFTNNGGSYSHDFVDSSGKMITSPNISYTGSFTASILSTDHEGLISEISSIQEGDYKFIQFRVNNVPSSGANYIIGMMTGMVQQWSWHIWIWPHSLSPVEITNSTGVKYNIMPVNLASKYDSDGVHIKNWFYQWGRKDPLALPATYNSTSNGATITLHQKATTNTSPLSGIQYPTVFYYNSTSPYNWFGTESYYNLWDAACTGTGNSDNDTVKTVYDPCPVGWKIPNGNTFTGLSILSSANGIVKMRRYSGDTVGMGFPLSGGREGTSGNIYMAYGIGLYWTSAPYNQTFNYYLQFNDSNVQPTVNQYRQRAWGMSIRPVQDDLTKIDTI